MMARVVIAVRGGKNAKSRCSGMLSGGDRERLVEAMLEDMLAVVGGTCNVEAAHVATPTARLADLSRQLGASVIEQPHCGLNAAFDGARRQLSADAWPGPVVLLPGDIPAIDLAELSRVVAAWRPGRLVIAPAHADGGTGALVLRGDDPFDLAFGADSFARHLAAARAAGLEPCVVESPGLAFDIDRPADLHMAVRMIPRRRTGMLLQSLLYSEAAA